MAVDLNLNSFSKWGASNLKPADFGTDQDFIADTHRTLCKINAHFTYDDKGPPDYYDRVASLPDPAWGEATRLTLGKLHTAFYQKVNRPIVIHRDLTDVCRKKFPAFIFEGGTLARR